MEPDFLMVIIIFMNPFEKLARLDQFFMNPEESFFKEGYFK
jgi:hypothetical protein